MTISSKDVQKIVDYTKEVKDTTKLIKSANQVNLELEEFEYTTKKIKKENEELKRQTELDNEKILELKSEVSQLKEEISLKDKIISKLQVEKEKVENALDRFIEFWNNTIFHFQEKIFNNNKAYKVVVEDLYNNNVINDREKTIIENYDMIVEPFEKSSKGSKYKERIDRNE